MAGWTPLHVAETQSTYVHLMSGNGMGGTKCIHVRTLSIFFNLSTCTCTL